MRIHVIGGGLAGLSAALTLAEAGRAVTIHEAGPAFGGRCRSYLDRSLGLRIDNGNHLLLSGNREAFAYLRRLGTEHTMGGPGKPVFPFLDLRTRERWTLRLGRSRVPFWMLSASRRVPGTTLAEHASLLRLLRAGPDATVADCLSPGPLAERLLVPLAIAVLNTMPDRGSASVLAAVFRDSLMLGGGACIPAFPVEGLSESFVVPAEARLAGLGAELRTGSRIGALVADAGRVVALEGPGGRVALASGDRVVLAVPAPVASSLLPGLAVPDAFEAIVNLHFRLDVDASLLPGSLGEAGFVGLVGGLAEWVFVKPGIVSVTVSAANRFEDLDADTLQARAWGEVVAALGLDPATPMPPVRLVREKRATFAATPDQERRRPSHRTALGNVTLAGDWTATGLPATIEGAIKSGRIAAEANLRRA